MNRWRTILVVICGLLSLGVVLVWYRSHRTSDLLIVASDSGRAVEVTTVPTQVRITVTRGWPGEAGTIWRPSEGEPEQWVPVFGRTPIYRNWYPPGIGVIGGTRRVLPPPALAGPGVRVMLSYTTIAVPFALPLVVLMAFPVYETWRCLAAKRRRRLRLAKGQCLACGYDMRASPDRCPECGAPARADDITRDGPHEGATAAAVRGSPGTDHP